MEIYDAIVVGSGPAGASVFKYLSEAGMNTLLLEKGKSMKPPRNSVAGLSPLKVRFLQDKTGLIQGVGTGGSSLLYFATAADPPEGYFEKYDLDLKPFLESQKKSLPYGVLKETLVGKRSRTLMEAASSLGYDWHLLPKLMHQDEAKLGKHPFIGRWTSVEYLDDGIRAGGEIQAKSDVIRVIHENNQVRGVEIKDGFGSKTIMAKKVILSAGGIGSPAILKRSGMTLSPGFFSDPLVFVVGKSKGLNAPSEIPMTSGMKLEKPAAMLTDIYLPPEVFAAFSASSLRFDYLLNFKAAMIIMVKIKDSLEGEVTADEKLLRRLSENEKSILNEGAAIAREILEKAGAKDIFETPVTAAHPGGTCRLGESVDRNLQTEVENLHVCDCSILPEPWGLPPTLTMAALGEYLAHQIKG